MIFDAFQEVINSQLGDVYFTAHFDYWFNNLDVALKDINLQGQEDHKGVVEVNIPSTLTI